MALDLAHQLVTTWSKVFLSVESSTAFILEWNTKADASTIVG